jgi:hypothetical protein
LLLVGLAALSSVMKDLDRLQQLTEGFAGGHCEMDCYGAPIE